MKSTYRSAVPASGGPAAISELRCPPGEVRAEEPSDAARAGISLPDKPTHRHLLCGSRQGGGTRGGMDAVRNGACLTTRPIHCKFQQQRVLWVLGFLPTHTWQIEPISSACLKLRLQVQKKGTVTLGGWLLRRSQMRGRGQISSSSVASCLLAGSAKPDSLALQQGSWLLLPCPPPVQGAA